MGKTSSRDKGSGFDRLDAAGEEAIFGKIADATTLTKVAREFGTSRRTLGRWVEQGGEARERGFKQARREAAEALMEEAGEILAAAVHKEGLTQPEITAAKELANHKRFLASKFNPELYGERPGAALNVSLDIGQLHLDALRQSGHMDRLPKPEPPLIEASVIQEGD